VAATSFADRLAAAIDRVGSPACVGLDPVLEKLPAEIRASVAASDHTAVARAFVTFSRGVIDACRGRIGVIKPQAACFERYGAPGVQALHDVIHAGHNAGMIVVLDAKRGDIGISAEHYAAAAFAGASPADSLTVSGYLGPDTIEPYLKHAGRGVFVLVRTSNPGSDAVQSLRLADGRTVAEMMADHVATIGAPRMGACGLSDVGAVVAATKPADAASLRARMPNQVFLIPGYGAQGGTADDLRGLIRAKRENNKPSSSGLLVTASRSVIYAFKDGGTQWADAVAAAAAGFAAEVAGIVG